ncbi:hypothetical protein OUY22_25655, partial [Nonomuraea sp. MCN248]
RAGPGARRAGDDAASPARLRHSPAEAAAGPGQDQSASGDYGQVGKAGSLAVGYGKQVGNTDETDEAADARPETDQDPYPDPDADPHPHHDADDPDTFRLAGPG